MLSTPEWLLWAKKLKDEHQQLKDRLKSVEAECERLRNAEHQHLEHRALETIERDRIAGSISDLEITYNDQVAEDATTIVDGLDDPEPALGAQPASAQHFDQENDALSHPTTQTVQGTLSLEAYLDHTHQKHLAYEEASVRSFLEGLASPHQRFALESALARKSDTLTWEALHAVVNKYIADADRRRRNKRTLATPPS